MLSARVWLPSALILCLCFRTVIAGIQDDTQVVFSQEEPASKSLIAEELSDLLQSSIWFQENRTDSSDVAIHCVRDK
jgi:hypothetical protein